MKTQGKFHVNTKNGRQRSLWLRLFGTDTLPVTSAFPQEVFYKDGRSQWVYTLDTAALGDHACRRLAAHVAAHRWGTTFESALVEVRRGWPVNADNCELVAAEEMTAEPAQNSPAMENPRVGASDTITRPTVLGNGREPRPRRNSRQRRAYGRSWPETTDRLLSERRDLWAQLAEV
jgi:hypothetical protein